MVKEVVYQVMAINYLINIAASVVALVFLSGCIKNIDLVTSFHFSGKVVEKETPISGVEVFFVDKRFDYVRSKDSQKGTHKLGTSTENGHFDLSFIYLWGYKEVFSKAKPLRTFDLIFKKAGFEEKFISYDSRNLLQKNNIIQIEIGEIS